MANNRIIQVPVTLDSANRKKDRSVKLSFTTTREISTEEYLTIDEYYQSIGWLLFKENEFNDEDVPKEQAESDTKTPSQRLRSVLYVYHLENGGAPETFRQFYEASLEKYINNVKEKLDAKK